MQPNRRSIFAHPLTAPLTSALLAIILFAPVTGYSYVYDALYIIQRDTRLADPWFGLKVWLSQWWIEGSTVPLSRPLTQFTFWLQTQIHGSDLALIAGSHVNFFLIVDLLLYAVLCAACAHLTRCWLSAGSQIINHKSAIINSYLVGLAFAVHPVHTEVVASSVGRADTLSLLFTIIGILLWLRWRSQPFSWRRSILIGLCVLAAGLAKESGFLLAPILVAVEIALRRLENRPIFHSPANPLQWDIPWRIVIIILSVASLAGIQREISKHSVEDMIISRPVDIDNPIVIATPSQRAVTPLKIFGTAVRLLSLPLTVDPRSDDPDLPSIRPLNSPDYSPRMLMPTDQLSDPLVMLGLFTTFAWLAAVLICWQKRLPPLGPLLVIPLAWFIPSNIFLIIGTILGERLILPLSCFVLIAVAAFIPWHRMIIPVRAIVFSLAAAFIFLFAYSTLLYLPAWQSNNHLQAYTISFHPLSGRFQGFWAVSLLIHGLEYPDQRDTYFKQAEYHARLALEYWPRNQQPYSVLGVIEHHRGNEDAAQRYLNYSRRGGGKWGIGEDFLASISQAQDQSAIRNNAEQLQKQLDDDPDNKALQLQLAIDYARLKEYPKAIRLFDKSVDIESETDFSILELYLDAAIARGTHEQVVQLIRRQLALRPDQWSILTDAALITMFDSKENSLEAKHWLERAIELSPGSPEPWAGLSMWYEIEGDQSKTLEMLNEALLRSSRDDPKWVHYQLRKEQLLERYKK